VAVESDPGWGREFYKDIAIFGALLVIAMRQPAKIAQ
jgi:hypothetical protein